MTRVFISGPIRGMPDYNVPAFMAAEKMLTDQGCAVMNPVKLHPANPDAFSHDDYMHICKAMLDVCDAIYLLPGWTDSKGAVEEAKHAIVHGITVWEVIT